MASQLDNPHVMIKILSFAVFAVSVLAILDRSYYDALELPVSCTPEEVRDAFRRLTRLYHPDRNPNSRGRFEMINNAYETLYDQNKKFLYDRVGIQKMKDPNVYNEFDFNKLKGPELKLKLFLTLKDFYMGKELDVLIQKQVACPHCRGTGAEHPMDLATCNECGGKGKTTRRVELGGGYYNIYTQNCPRCQGKGKIIGRRCHLCQSVKIISGIEEFKVKIQPGTQSNSDLRYPNMGDERMEGAPSDVVFELVQVGHPYFRREGHSLFMTMAISLQEAILGFSKTVKHLDGHDVVISRDEITQPGSIEMIEGQGMPLLGSTTRGSLYVTFNVEIPSFSNQELDTLEDFFRKKGATR